MSTQNNMEIQDHLGNVYNPKTIASQVKMEDNRDLSNYDVSTTQKGFMSAEDKVKLDKVYTQTNELYQDVTSNQASVTINDTVAGAVQNIEILGNTYQNPSNLAEIKSVGKLRDDGLYEVSVKSYGKNIFNEELFVNTLKQHNSSKVSIVTEEGKRCVKIIEAHLFKGFVLPFYFNKNKQYTFTFTNKHITQASFVIVVNYEDGTHSTFDKVKLGSFNKQTYISKPNSIIRSVEITFAQGGGTTFIDLDSFQIEESNVATLFEPYKETVSTIKLPCQLEGIGDIKDRFYFDKQQGKWFIEKKIGETILTELNSWQYLSGFDSTNHMGFFLTNMPNMEIQPVFSDKFNNSSNINLDEELVAMTTPGGNKRLFLKIAKTKLTTQDVNGLKNWLKTNNVLVKYVISPSAYQLIELPLDTQIVLNSFDGITHIELDGGEIQGTIKCKVSKSLKSSVNSLVEKTDNLDNRVKQIEGLKESQSLAYQSPKGSLVCTDTKNGIIEDLKISGRTMVNYINAIDSGFVTQGGATMEKLVAEQCYKINFTSTEWSGCRGIPCFSLDPSKTYTLVIDVLENTCTNKVDMAHKLYDPNMFRHDYLIEPRWTGRCHLIKYTGRSSLSPKTYVYQTGASGYIKARYMVLEGDYTGANSNLIPEYFEGIKNVDNILTNLTDTSSRSYTTQAGGVITKISNGFKINFSSYQWSGGLIPVNFDVGSDKEYTVIINVLKNTCSKIINLSHYDDLGYGMNTRIPPNWTGTKIGKIQRPSRQGFFVYVESTGSSTSEYIEVQFIVVEGDYRLNPPSDYFEGTKNFGINLKTSSISFYRRLRDCFVNVSEPEYKYTSNGFSVLEYRISGNINVSIRNAQGMKTNGNGSTIRFNDSNNKLLSTLWVPDVMSTTLDINFVTPPGTHYMAISLSDSKTVPMITIDNNHIKPIFYYDSNGDMKIVPELREWDTIEKHSDGKYYYHKVSGETTLTGDENWTVGLTGTPNFYYELPITLTSKTGGDKVICNTLPYSAIGSSTTAMGISTTQDGRLRIRLNSEIPLADFKQWLKTNSTTAVFKAPQEEIYECVDLTLSSYEGMTNIQTISGAIKPNIEFKISSHINNVVLSNRDRINNIEKDFIDYVASQSAITLETRYMLDNMLPNNIDDYEENIDYNIYELLKKNIENDNVFIKKEKLMEMLDFYFNTKKINQGMYDELLEILTRDVSKTLEINY